MVSNKNNKIKSPLSVNDVMKLTGVARVTVYRWLKSGRIKGKKWGSGGSFLIDPKSLPDFVVEARQ